MRLLIRILGVIVFVLLIISFFHHPKPVAKQAAKPAPVSSGVCSSNAPPCIEMITPDRTYMFNDFRFKPNGCITFDALPGHVAGNYCGPFRLNWIGPSNG